jgi:hypothetical protein
MAQAFGIVDILISGKAAERRLLKQPDQRMAAVLAGRRSPSTSPAIALRPTARSSSR